MREIPDCLNRRYKVLNDLIDDITTAMPASMGSPGCGGCGSSSGGGSGAGTGGGSGAGRGGSGAGRGGSGCGRCSSRATDPPDSEEAKSEDKEVGVKLMCDFWKILQADPDYNLTQAVQNRMCIDSCTNKCKSACSDNKVGCKSSASRSGGGCGCGRSRGGSGGGAGGSGGGGSGSGSKVKLLCTQRSKDSTTRRPKKHDCGAARMGKDPQLSKALGNLKQAASFEKKCSVRVRDLVSAQKDLTEQINNLEDKEKKGVGLMKEADCMWSCMEESYKNKLAASQERFKELQKQLKEVDGSSNKWRKNKKDLEFQLRNIEKSIQEINEKKIQKENDIKVMQLEIAGFQKRIASNQKDMDAAKNSYTSKKNASDARITKITEEIEKLQNKIVFECKCKADKESEGSGIVKEARDELQKICRGLLQKKLENEDLRAEREALIQEIGLLKSTCQNCTTRCAKREQNIVEETKRIDKEITGFKAKCTKCNKHTDSSDVMGFCIDCPRCLIERECLNEGDHCVTDHSKDCVCTQVKKKFLDNVFENMYTVLEKQVNTCPGKELADCIFNCLKKSRNGKLDEKTRKILLDFVLSTVKKNLNLTIVGGAVKTRCELEPDIYKQLMLCLKDVAVTRPVKEDKGTVVKKPPCSRWHSSNECNCPKGPKSCPCTKRAPKPPNNLGSCGHSDTEEVVDMSVKICPKRESTACGVDCGMLGVPGASEWRREPCGGQTCPFAANMRAAQCVLGPDSLAGVQPSRTTPPIVPSRPTPPIVPSVPLMEKATCISGGKAVKSCHTDTNHLRGDMKDNFNEGTKAEYQEKTNENLQLELSLSDASPVQERLKPISSLQKAILFSEEHQEKILEEFTKNNLNQSDTKEQFQIAFKNENGQSNLQFTKLTQTPSGKLAFELDEQTIKIIEDKSMTDPYLFMSINKYGSGHVLVDFDTKQNVIDKTRRVTVRRTSSGTKLLDIHKNMIRLLKNTLLDNKPNADLSKTIKLPPSPNRSESPIDADTEVQHILISDKHLLLKSSIASDSDLPLKGNAGLTNLDDLLEQNSDPILTELYKKNKKKKDLKCTCPKTSDTGKENAIPECSCDTNTSPDSWQTITECDSPQQQQNSSAKSSTTRSVDNCNYRREFKQLYKQGNANVALEIQVGNGEVQKLSTVVTKTESGSIAIYARGVSSLQEISFDRKECPVLLTKSAAGSYFVKIGNIDQNFNATLRKSPPGGVLLIPQSFKKKYHNDHEVFFKVKVCVMTNQLLELPAVLKPTLSKNYIVVLDKEFETCYKETLKEYFGDNLEGSVDLRTTSSGNYLLELDNEDESYSGKKNALLVKTSSGHMKVVVNDPEFDSVVQQKSSITSTPSALASTQIIGNLPTSSREYHRENLRKSNNLSDEQSKTQLFGKVEGNNPEQLLSDLSIVLKKTPSGQYAVLLNEDSKKSLLNNLQCNSLTSNTEELVPIKRLSSGEIIIDLNNRDERQAHYGTLRVTTSGSFYVIVSEEVMKDLTEGSINNQVACNTVGARSEHAAKLIDSVHKAVATTGQLKSDDCCCDPSTCVCADRLFDTLDESNDKIAQLCACVWRETSADKNNAINNNSGVPIPTTSTNNSGQIDHKPCDSTARKKKYETTEQCFYWLESNRQHKGCSYGVSNELLQKTEFRQAHENQPDKRVKFEAKSESESTEQNEVWDSFDYLPPQLPYFLKDFRYR